MRTTFGTYLRKAREKAGYRLGEFARLLDVSGPYLSDVELGNRHPFGSELIEKAADLLTVPVHTLKILAAETRGGSYSLEPVTTKHQLVGRALMRRWQDLSEAELSRIKEILGDGGQDD